MMLLNHRRTQRQRTLDLVAGRVSIEAGASDVWTLQSERRLAVLAHFASTSQVSRSFRTLVRELRDAGYGVLVVSAAESRQALDWGGAMPPGTVVLRKPNVGYDFGSWAVGLEFLGPRTVSERVILANDSMVGPFASIRPLLCRLETSAADVWGLTDTWQFSHHLQSYFLAFRGEVLDEPAMRDFFRGVRQEPTKQAVIRRNEMGLSRLLFSEGYVWEAAFRADLFVEFGANPVIRGWQQLLRSGFPFVKREIIRRPSIAPGGERVAEAVNAVYGAQLSDWL